MSLSPLRQQRLAQATSQPWPKTYSSELHVRYHGVPLCLVFLDRTVREQVQALLPVPWVSPVPIPEALRIHLKALPTEEDPDDQFQTVGEWVVQRDFLARHSPGEVWGHITAIEDSFYNLMRYLLPPRLHHQGVLVLHSACVVDHANQAHVFLGDSGAGKTTLSKMSHPRLILGDDVNLVAIRDGIVQASVAHLGQAYTSPADLDRWFAVAGLYTLSQAPHCQLRPLSTLATVKALSKAIFFSHAGKAEYLLSTVNEMVTKTPSSELSFAKHSDVWRCLRGESTETQGRPGLAEL